MLKPFLLQTDGACLGNPGAMGLGAVLYNETDNIIFEKSVFAGHGTNNEAEYLALILGLKKALECKAENILIKLDSELIVKQINGQYKVKNERLKVFYNEVIQLLENFKSFQVSHVFRAFNKEADCLASQAAEAGKLGKLQINESFKKI